MQKIKKRAQKVNFYIFYLLFTNESIIFARNFLKRDYWLRTLRGPASE